MKRTKKSMVIQLIQEGKSNDQIADIITAEIGGTKETNLRYSYQCRYLLSHGPRKKKSNDDPVERKPAQTCEPSGVSFCPNCGINLKPFAIALRHA